VAPAQRRQQNILQSLIDPFMNDQANGGDHGLHWPDLDQDLSTEGLLPGAPAPKTHIFAKK